MKPLRRAHHGRVRFAQCRHCDERLAYVEQVGWLDPVPDHSYDICPGDPYGNHEPPAKRSEFATKLIGPE